jgi:hypothetical protein
MISDMITVLLSILFVAAIVALLERNHRRTDGLPRAPFGTDAPDRDLDRVVHDIHAARPPKNDQDGSTDARGWKPGRFQGPPRLITH